MLSLLLQEEGMSLITCPAATATPKNSFSCLEDLVSLLRCVPMTGRLQNFPTVYLLSRLEQIQNQPIRQKLFSLTGTLVRFEGDRKA